MSQDKAASLKVTAPDPLLAATVGVYLELVNRVTDFGRILHYKGKGNPCSPPPVKRRGSGLRTSVALSVGQRLQHVVVHGRSGRDYRLIMVAQGFAN